LRRNEPPLLVHEDTDIEELVEHWPVY
jgi:hypothetical protein